MERHTTLNKKIAKIAAMMVLFFGFYLGVVHSNQTGPIPGVTGVPAGGGFPKEPNCTEPVIGDLACHTTNAANTDEAGTTTTIALVPNLTTATVPVPDNYIPGQTYTMRFAITSTDTTRRRWGFELSTVSKDTFAQAGVLNQTDRLNTLKVIDMTRGNRQYIGHSVLGTGANRTGTFGWNFSWTAPETNIGDVALYSSGNAANNDSLPLNDRIFTKSPEPMTLIKGQYTFVNRGAAAGLAPSGATSNSAVGDIDKDGKPDVLLVRNGQIALFRNKGDGTFADVTAASMITTGMARVNAAAFGDINADGAADLYLVNAGADMLFSNNGSGIFTNVTVARGISDSAVGHGAVFGDVAGDNKPDLFVTGEGSDILYINGGTGTFTKATLPAETAVGWAAAIGDVDGDMRNDIVVANDGQAALYKNGGNSVFTEVAVASGVVTAMVQARAVTLGDFNKDAKLDIFFANVGADLLFRNGATAGTFTDGTTAAGIAADTAVALGAAFVDYDNDADVDLVVVNTGQDLLYRNNGNNTFNSVATFSGMTDMAMGSGVSTLDYDGDKNIDLLITNGDAGNFLYKNPGKAGPAPAASAEVAKASLSFPWRIASLGLIPVGLFTLRSRRKINN